MEANELRMGNYFLETGSKIIYKLDCFYGFGTVKPYQEYDDDMYFDIDDISPIPLTEEVLLKCGFEKQDYNMSNCHVYQRGIYRVLKSFNSDNINQDYSLCINGISPPTWSIAHFKFVHQFQNIIHALTNTELEINL